MDKKILYAFDFDGVLCDSAVETAITGYHAACAIWPDMPLPAAPALIAQCRTLRPFIETGYETVLVMRRLFLGETVADIQQNYPGLNQSRLQDAAGGVAVLKNRFGAARDRWIAEDLPGWLAMNPLYPGIALNLKTIQKQNPYCIVTTKQERFVKQILNAQHLALPDQQIFGLERNLTKPQVLRHLLKAYPDHTVVFVEDRLLTLEQVLKAPDLSDVKPVFALWGYNTAADQARASGLPVISLTLEQFWHH